MDKVNDMSPEEFHCLYDPGSKPLGYLVEDTMFLISTAENGDKTYSIWTVPEGKDVYPAGVKEAKDTYTLCIDLTQHRPHKFTVRSTTDGYLIFEAAQLRAMYGFVTRYCWRKYKLPRDVYIRFNSQFRGGVLSLTFQKRKVSCFSWLLCHK